MQGSGSADVHKGNWTALLCNGSARYSHLRSMHKEIDQENV